MTSVLIVEDEPQVALELAEVLEDLGYRVLGKATTGEEALKLAGEARPDVALMDVRLAGAVDGIATARDLAQRYRTPVIFLTAHADAATLTRARAAEAFGYLVKPCEALELRAAIETAVMRAEVERERDALIVELRAANAQIKVLRGLLPICSYCKRIRDPRGHWQELERFISRNSEASFSHGLCVECLEKHYPEYAQDGDAEKPSDR